jgi:very-long-chain (3R)-3-hydroxyacyl-CoA dehydratase
MPPKSSSKSSAKPTSGAKNTYLLAYNALSAALWAGVLYQTLTIGSAEVSHASKDGWIKSGESVLGALQEGLGSGKVYDGLEVYTRGVQSLAGLEVMHSVFGK